MLHSPSRDRTSVRDLPNDCCSGTGRQSIPALGEAASPHFRGSRRAISSLVGFADRPVHWNLVRQDPGGECCFSCRWLPADAPPTQSSWITERTQLPRRCNAHLDDQRPFSLTGTNSSGIRFIGSPGNRRPAQRLAGRREGDPMRPGSADARAARMVGRCGHPDRSPRPPVSAIWYHNAWQQRHVGTGSCGLVAPGLVTAGRLPAWSASWLPALPAPAGCGPLLFQIFDLTVSLQDDRGMGPTLALSEFDSVSAPPLDLCTGIGSGTTDRAGESERCRCCAFC